MTHGGRLSKPKPRLLGWGRKKNIIKVATTSSFKSEQADLFLNNERSDNPVLKNNFPVKTQKG